MEELDGVTRKLEELGPALGCGERVPVLADEPRLVVDKVLGLPVFGEKTSDTPWFSGTELQTNPHPARYGLSLLVV